MNIPKFFIQRPVTTVIFMMAFAIFGSIAYFYLAVNELPNVDFPTLVVAANLPGADPETMAASVAVPIEKELSSIAGIDSMSSVSTTGNTQIAIQFTLDRSIDAAAQDVQSALLQVSRDLPPDLPHPPLVRKINPAQSPILFLALVSPYAKLTQINEYAENYIAPRLSMINGVAEVDILGPQKYAVRINLNAYALYTRKLTIDTVARAIQNMNSNQPTGILEGAGIFRAIKVQGKFNKASDYANAIVANVNGVPIRLKEIATVEDSVENNKTATWYNDNRAIVLAVQRQPGANTVAVVDQILKVLPQLTQDLPGGSELKIVYDRAEFIKVAIRDVQYTLMFAIILVGVVMWLFFHSFRATLIATLSLPVSVVATFALMYLLNYSLDTLSLMALVLAVGFIIDDTVVVLENIVRYVEKGFSPMAASLKGAKEVSFTVISMTLSLSAVFIPIFFMGGIVGRLFYEFAAVVGISIMFSGVVALTLIPMLCSKFITPNMIKDLETMNGFERGFLKLKNFYERTLRYVIEKIPLTLLFSFIIILLTMWLFYLVPKGFIPSEDINLLNGTIHAPAGMTFDAIVREQQAAATIIRKNPNVEALVSSVGGSSALGSNGRFVIKLKPQAQRSIGADEISQQLRQALQALTGLKIFITNPLAIRVGGRASSNNYQYAVQGIDWLALQAAATELTNRIRLEVKGISDLDNDLELNNPELRLKILQDQATLLGVTPAAIQSALFSAYGERQINRIFTLTGDYNVIMSMDPKYQRSINDVNLLTLTSSTGQPVPLSSVTKISEGAGPLAINHYGQLPAIIISFNLSPKVALGDVSSQIQALAKKVLPQNVSGNFVGTAQSFQQSLKNLPILLLFTILVIYMVLAVLYEHFGYPIVILTALPFAVFGAILSLLVFNQDLDIFSFIGLIMLVGLSKKNGIMMVDFALESKRNRNLSAKEAIIEACIIRFRPIMMTTLAALVTTLPIALGWGAGGETRRGLGISVAGGLLFSQLITLYVTPVFYLVMDKISHRKDKDQLHAG